MEGTFTRFGPDGSIFMTVCGQEQEFTVDPDNCKTCGGCPVAGDRLRIDGRPAVKVENLSRPDTGNKIADAAAKGFHGTNDQRAD